MTRDHRKIIDYLKLHGINLEIRFILVLPRWFYTRFYLTWLYYIFNIRYLRNHIIKNDINLIHCRSYHAAIIALKVKNKFKLPVKIIFDTRGLFPEEGVFLGFYPYKSLSYRFWKYKEKELLKNCDIVVNVSEQFTEHIKSIIGEINTETIYTSIDQYIIYKDLNLRELARIELNILEEEKALVYCGSISLLGWHSIEALLSVYEVFQKTFIKTKLIILTQSSHEILRNQLNQNNLVEDDYRIIKSKNLEQTNKYLNAADYSCLPYRKNKNEVDRLIGHTMLATKTGEYLGTGLPLLVNENVGGAASLVNKHGLGIVYKEDRISDIGDAIKNIENNYNDISEKCIEVANKHFDIVKNAFKYIDIYKKLTENKNYLGS